MGGAQGDGGSVISADGGGEGGCGGRGVGVGDAEIEDAISRCGGIVGGVFVFESVEESFCLCVWRVPPPSLAKVKCFLLRDGSGDGVGDAAQADGDGVAIVEVEIGCHRMSY